MRGSVNSAPFLNLKKGYNEVRKEKIDGMLSRASDPHMRNKLMEAQYLQDPFNGVGTVYNKYASPY